MQGLHLTADLSGVDPGLALMRDPEALAQCCREAVLASGLLGVAELTHRFGPAEGQSGVTGVVLLAESHVAVHTWPELGAVTLDVYVCNFGADNSAKARRLMDQLLQRFDARELAINELRRGGGAPARHARQANGVIAFCRNLALLMAMVWLAAALAVWADGESWAADLPQTWSYETRHALAVNLSVAAGAVIGSLVLSLLLLSRRPAIWVIGFGIVMAALNTWSHLTWVSGAGLYQLQFGPGLMWGPVAIALAVLTGMRLATAANRWLRRRSG
ncbi:adenosylmethionine decarboxylase [Roseateles paludis]|jgi:S-adenosylmethionine decarboxylase proenzyme|uniref:Adenosylmethionine decarboxylase n=1 Tax=Roseateles paludis TaxID=3145238 RepID=A0ABV0G1F4_9BURK